MSRYRHALPQCAGGRYLTDGGLETTLVFLESLELPCFAAFPLLQSAEGRARLERYFRTHAAIAAQHGVGFVLESATWRANPDWAARLGIAGATLDDLNREGVAMLVALRDELEQPGAPMVVSGCVGPRDDGYRPNDFMSIAQAQEYHSAQVACFAAAGADLVTAMTMTYAEEAAGIALAARSHGMPVVVSFTTETDGRLPPGRPLGDAITEVDERTDGAPAYYMVNCAHPDHFARALDVDAPWVSRVRGLRANASRQSHDELDAADELDAGDPDELGHLYAQLVSRHPQLCVLGGCCGTDHRHIKAIARRCFEDR